MPNQPERPFPRPPRRLQQIPGFNCQAGKLNLLDNIRLADLLDTLAHLPHQISYPLQATFYQNLMACDLLLPVPAQDVLPEGLSLISLENQLGERGLPVFTCEDNLSEWDNETLDYVAMPFASLCGLALEARLDYIVVNIAGPFGCEISFHDFSYLAEGLIPPPDSEQTRERQHPRPGEVLVAQHTPMRIGLCEHFPEHLSCRLQQVFKQHDRMIEQVYLFNIGFNEGPLQPALGIRMPEPQEPLWEVELWPNLQAVLHEMLERHDVVNVFLLNQTGSLEKHVQALTTPIYPC